MHFLYTYRCAVSNFSVKTENSLNDIWAQEQLIDLVSRYEVPVNSGDDPNTLILPVYMRERRVKQGCGNNYQQTSPQLFGQPLLVAIPRNNCTYDVLYNCVLNKMA